MRFASRVVAGVAGAGALAGVLFLLFRPAPVRVETGPVVRGGLVVTVDEEGETRVRDRFVVAAPVSGRLERIALDEGDPVEENAVVAHMHPLPLDPRTYAEASARLDGAEAARREADARVEQARAALDQARREALRARQLAAHGTISESERERADLDETTRSKELEAALFAARAADYNAQAARAALLASGGATAAGDDALVELRAPVGGRVLRVHEESERVVPVGAPLLEIGDPDALEIVVDVLSTDAVKVHPGALLLVEEWGGEHTLKARVRRVEPSGFTKVSALGVEEQRVNIIADFEGDASALGDGYRVEARIVVWEGENVVKAPASALFRRGSDWSVFVVQRDRARLRAIEIGQRNPTEVEVRAGLAEGEMVILHPSDLISDGTRVKALGG